MARAARTSLAIYGTAACSALHERLASTSAPLPYVARKRPKSHLACKKSAGIAGTLLDVAIISCDDRAAHLFAECAQSAQMQRPCKRLRETASTSKCLVGTETMVEG